MRRAAFVAVLALGPRLAPPWRVACPCVRNRAPARRRRPAAGPTGRPPPLGPHAGGWHGVKRRAILLPARLEFLSRWYKYSELFEDVSDEGLNQWILFILWIVFCPAVWFLVQMDLNRKAEATAT